jgi:hypothetical protein
MKHRLSLILSALLLLNITILGQDRPRPVSLIQLIANPDKFDGKLIAVWGFLRVQHEEKHAVRIFLYLHQEDAKNMLTSNMIFVNPTDQMLKDEERIDRMYVMLTGVFVAVRAAGNDSLQNGGVIRDARSCVVWSDPSRPVGLKNESAKNR